jgi:hypothetical protein
MTPGSRGVVRAWPSVPAYPQMQGCSHQDENQLATFKYL